MEQMIGWATVVIAIFTVVLAVYTKLQLDHGKMVARANYMVTLHDKRMEVYFAVEDYLSHFWREGRPSLDEAARMRFKLRTAHFVFPKGALTFIDELWEKTREYHVQYNKWEPLRARAYAQEQLSEKEIEAKEVALAAMHEIEDWFVKEAQGGRLEADLGPYLRLPESI